jgi:chromosome segregation ATPase
MEEAAAARERARKEYTHGTQTYRDSRDDEIAISTPKITQAFSFREDNFVNDDIQMSIDEGKKIVSELKREVEQLKKDAEKADAEASKTISAEKAKMQAEIEEMKKTLGEKKENLQAAKNELAEKERMSKSAELTLEGKENQLNTATRKNEDLRKQLETVRRHISSYKMKTSNLDNHLETLSRTMQTLIKEHEEIMRVSKAHEEHVKTVQANRQKKMQELIDQEVEFVRNSLEKHKNSDLGSEEGVNQALEKQKELMSSITSVLSGRV